MGYKRRKTKKLYHALVEKICILICDVRPGSFAFIDHLTFISCLQDFLSPPSEVITQSTSSAGGNYNFFLEQD